VVNYDLPNIPESYVHRIGRTARAGAEGIAISFCDHEEMAFLRGIEKLIGLSLPVTDRRTAGGAPYRSGASNNGYAKKRPNGGRGQQQRAHGSGRGQQQRGDGPQQPRGNQQQPVGRNNDSKRRRGQQRPQYAPRPQQHQVNAAPSNDVAAPKDDMAGIAFMQRAPRRDTRTAR